MWSKIFIGLKEKYHNFSDVWWNLSFLERFPKNTQIINSMKTVRWEPSCSMRTNRQTGMAKLIVAFRNLANAPKKTMNAEDGNTDDLLQCTCASLPILFSLCSWLWRHSKRSYLYATSQDVRTEGHTAFSRRAWVSFSYVTRELVPPYVTLPFVITGFCGLPTVHPCSITKCLKVLITRKLTL